MFIVSKDKRAIVNTDWVTSVHIGADGCTLKADFQNGNGCQIGRYMSEEECMTAMDIITGMLDACSVPDDSAVIAKINLGGQRLRHISGKKTKGHGGS